MTTTLAVAIKQAFPQASIDYLVFEGTEGVLAHNPLIRRVITVPHKKYNLGVLLPMFRKYDVAFAAYPSDRTLIAAAIAGKYSVGLTYNTKMLWKRIVLNAYRLCDDRVHVMSNLQALLSHVGIPPVPKVAAGYDDADLAYARQAMPAGRYVILHPFSRNRCKYWPAESWSELAALIQQRTDCRVVFTRTPAEADRTYLEPILAGAPVETLAFTEPCTLAQLAAAIKGSAAFVGIDTAVTHTAAALEVPTLALFGPSLTRYWGPWPNGCCEASPFAANKGVQRVGNVTVVQKDWPCVPCNRESCVISTRGKMECLEELAALEVFDELEKALRTRG